MRLFTPHPHTAPDHDCMLCPRLAAFRDENRKLYPHFFNGPVPSFGDTNPWLLVVGMAPGLQGANQTGRPFTRDGAGEWLYPILKKMGLASGDYGRHINDGFTLKGVHITNAVRCVPPQNKLIAEEITQCNQFLRSDFSRFPHLKAVLALGHDAHKAILKTFQEKPSQYRFAHGAAFTLKNGLKLYNSYHCSRYNTNTGRLTESMFQDVFDLITKINPENNDSI